jgi:Fe(3+) dicitrate transport protein
MFAANPRAATRSRNWYSPDITVPSLLLTWQPSARMRATLLASGVFGARSSVAVGGFATTPDEPSGTRVWSTRQVDIDRYTTRSVEARAYRDASIAGRRVTWSGGLAITDNDMRRRQQGVGSRLSDYSLALQPGGDFKRDLHYRTKNIAGYAEAELHLSDRWTLVPGARVERGTTHMTGRLAYYDPTNTPRDIRHAFPLLGVRSSFVVSSGAEWYGGFSQAYRPMILKDVLPETVTERTDAGLRDARGWTLESGVRGTHRGIGYDVGGFVMRYANRFGMLTVTDASGTPYTYKTNVGTTRTVGFEGRVSAPIGVTRAISWRAFSALSLMDAQYIKGSVVSVGQNVDVSGNAVESAPRVIARGGLNARRASAEATLQVSYVSRTFADALNTITPSATGAVGVVPAYALVDASASWPIRPRLRLVVGANNLFDRQHFTKRPQFYPGPGVWPSDGRTFQVSLRVLPSAGY